MSDAAYEKQHHKYKTFKKRQRLRKKEKLKHKQYRLKERIEQLRALEPSVFLHITDSFFVVTSPCAPPDEDGTEHDVPRPNRNVQSQSHSNGEWHKRRILDVASSLEAHYHTLLNGAPVDHALQYNRHLHHQHHQRLHQPLHLPQSSWRMSLSL